MQTKQLDSVTSKTNQKVNTKVFLQIYGDKKNVKITEEITFTKKQYTTDTEASL